MPGPADAQPVEVGANSPACPPERTTPPPAGCRRRDGHRGERPDTGSPRGPGVRASERSEVTGVHVERSPVVTTTAPPSGAQQGQGLDGASGRVRPAPGASAAGGSPAPRPTPGPCGGRPASGRRCRDGAGTTRTEAGSAWRWPPGRRGRPPRVASPPARGTRRPGPGATRRESGVRGPAADGQGGPGGGAGHGGAAQGDGGRRGGAAACGRPPPAVDEQPARAAAPEGHGGDRGATAPAGPGDRPAQRRAGCRRAPYRGSSARGERPDTCHVVTTSVWARPRGRERVGLAARSTPRTAVRSWRPDGGGGPRRWAD